MEKNNAPNVPPRLKEKVQKVLENSEFCSVLAAMVFLEILASELIPTESNDQSDSQKGGN